MAQRIERRTLERKVRGSILCRGKEDELARVGKNFTSVNSHVKGAGGGGRAVGGRIFFIGALGD